MPLGSDRLMRILLVVLGVAVLAGCASPGSPGPATQWVIDNEQQKARLEAQGFPQYTGAN
jgi:outer membrane biogenesis lipoprotein LolB